MGWYYSLWHIGTSSFGEWASTTRIFLNFEWASLGIDMVLILSLGFFLCRSIARLVINIDKVNGEKGAKHRERGRKRMADLSPTRSPTQTQRSQSGNSRSNEDEVDIVISTPKSATRGTAVTVTAFSQSTLAVPGPSPPPPHAVDRVADGNGPG